MVFPYPSYIMYSCLVLILASISEMSLQVPSQSRFWKGSIFHPSLLHRKSLTHLLIFQNTSDLCIIYPVKMSRLRDLQKSQSMSRWMHQNGPRCLERYPRSVSSKIIKGSVSIYMQLNRWGLRGFVVTKADANILSLQHPK